MDSRTRVSLQLLKPSRVQPGNPGNSIPLHGCCCCSCLQVWQVVRLSLCPREAFTHIHMHTHTEDSNMSGYTDCHRQGTVFSSSPMNTRNINIHIKQPSPAPPLWFFRTEVKTHTYLDPVDWQMHTITNPSNDLIHMAGPWATYSACRSPTCQFVQLDVH